MNTNLFVLFYQLERRTSIMMHCGLMPPKLPRAYEAPGAKPAHARLFCNAFGSRGWMLRADMRVQAATMTVATTTGGTFKRIAFCWSGFTRSV